MSSRVATATAGRVKRAWVEAPVTRADGPVRSVDLGSPSLTVGPEERADGAATIAVRMRGANGESAPATLILSATGA